MSPTAIAPPSVPFSLSKIVAYSVKLASTEALHQTSFLSESSLWIPSAEPEVTMAINQSSAPNLSWPA
jgi:hypothetical protein